MTERISLNAVIPAAPARVLLTKDATGRVTGAALDLGDLPRVERLLIGHPVMEVPRLVERLCSICPAVHQLAGVRALEDLAGLTRLPSAAQSARRLLHHSSVILTHVTTWAASALPSGAATDASPSSAIADLDDVLVLRQFAKSAAVAAGSPGHFPQTAIPGGVTSAIDPAERDNCLVVGNEALTAAIRVADRALQANLVADVFGGADLGLVNDRGHLDLFGTRLRGLCGDGSPVFDDTPAQMWSSLVSEAEPGAVSPRPFLAALGPNHGFRVGPVAQLRIAPIPTATGAELQARWRQRSGGATAARAIIVVFMIESIMDLLAEAGSESGRCAAPWPGLPARGGDGIGVVDGARGLLVHHYRVGEGGALVDATIMTPTVQNERWLGELLLAATRGTRGIETRRIEAAIHEADPCLPCASAPLGRMDLEIQCVPLVAREADF